MNSINISSHSRRSAHGIDNKEISTRPVLYPVRFYLFTGDTLSLACDQKWSFGIIKEKIVSKKPMLPAESSHVKYLFQLRHADVTFESKDTFQKFLSLRPVFYVSSGVGRHPICGSMLEINMIMITQIGDQFARQALKPYVYLSCEPSKHIILKTTGDYKHILTEGTKIPKTLNRVFSEEYIICRQRYTLFLYDTEQYGQEGTRPIGYIPLEFTAANRMKRSPFKKKFAYSIILTPLVKTTSSKARNGNDQNNNIIDMKEHSIILGFLNDNDAKELVNDIKDIQVRRVSSIIARITQTLGERNSLSVEGIFRISGMKAVIESLYNQYYRGGFPDFSQATVHDLCSLLKHVIHTLQEPIFPKNFQVILLKISELLTIEEKINYIIHDLIDKLERRKRYLLRFILTFLNCLDAYSNSNLMTIDNLGIVFSPVLMPLKNIKMSTMGILSKTNAEILSFLIYHNSRLWGKYMDCDYALSITGSFKQKIMDRTSIITKTDKFLTEFRRASSSVISLTNRLSFIDKEGIKLTTILQEREETLAVLKRLESALKTLTEVEESKKKKNNNMNNNYNKLERKKATSVIMTPSNGHTPYSSLMSEKIIVNNHNDKLFFINDNNDDDDNLIVTEDTPAALYRPATIM